MNQVAAHFNRAAAGYDKVATLQQCVGMELLQQCAQVNVNPTRIIDLGAGTGWLTAQLQQQYPRSDLLAVDLAWQMLAYAQTQRGLETTQLLCADLMALPLTDACCDLVFSNLMLQWCVPLLRAIRALQRLMRPNAYLAVSTFGSYTLQELRHAWAQVDTHPHVNTQVTQRDYTDALSACGLDIVGVQRSVYVRYYPDVKTLLHELRAQGASHLWGERKPGLMSKHSWQQLNAYYAQHRLPNGALPATFEVFYALARKRHLTVIR